MRVLAIALLSQSKEPTKMDFVDIAYNVSSFSWFVRSTITEYLKFACRTIADNSLVAGNTNTNILVTLTSSSSDLDSSLGGESKEKKTIAMPNEIGGFKAHCFVTTTGNCCVMITDEEYPSRVAFSIISKKVRDCTVGGSSSSSSTSGVSSSTLLAQDIVRFQNPLDLPEAKIEKINKELDKVKEIMHENISAVIARGEDINSLMKKSEDLSKHSKIFIDDTKRLNRCCKLF